MEKSLLSKPPARIRFHKTSLPWVLPSFFVASQGWLQVSPPKYSVAALLKSYHEVTPSAAKSCNLQSNVSLSIVLNRRRFLTTTERPARDNMLVLISFGHENQQRTPWPLSHRHTKHNTKRNVTAQWASSYRFWARDDDRGTKVFTPYLRPMGRSLAHDFQSECPLKIVIQ